MLRTVKIFQPILILGVMLHFTMGFVLELKNRKSREVKYNSYKGALNAAWVSRNMILSGIVVLLFLGLHLYDFWIPEMDYKYVEILPLDPDRYFDELVHKFKNPVRVGIYVLSFIFGLILDAVLVCHVVWVVGFQSGLKKIDFSWIYQVEKLAQNW